MIRALLLLALLAFGCEAPGTRATAGPTVESLFAAKQGDTWVELEAEVIKKLPVDDKGSRHQRFLIRTSSGQTVLVAHNIDLAKSVPLRRGDRVRLRGEYEYNDKGGVLHWTHHDPKGRHKGGWIDHDGRRYK